MDVGHSSKKQLLFDSKMPLARVENLSQLYSRPGFLLRRAHQISVSIFEESCADLNLSPAQYAVLITLQDLPKVNQGDVARAIGMNKVTVSQVVQGLEVRGWITRTTEPGDRRSRQLMLTRTGKNVVKRAAAMVQSAYDVLMAPFSEAERKLLKQLLQRAVHELEPYARTPFEPALHQAANTVRTI